MPAEEPTITMHRLRPTDDGPEPMPVEPNRPPTEAPNPSTTTDPEASDGSTATMTRLPPPVPATVPVAVRGAVGEEWVVGLGDSFWSIAEESLAEATPGEPPDDAAITRYWRRIVQANRDRLADPANPDLLLPGQTIVVPPP
jgi:nucleoid-associated protein YgaU